MINFLPPKTLTNALVRLAVLVGLALDCSVRAYGRRTLERWPLIVWLQLAEWILLS
jgi:hypothetical protein